MKKLKFIANIFFLISLILMLLVILQQLNIIRFLPTTVDPYKPTTQEAINNAVKYRLLLNSIGYIFLLISIIIHIINLIITLKSKNKISSPNSKNILLILIKIFLFICIIIFTFFVVWLSLFITLLGLMTLS